MATKDPAPRNSGAKTTKATESTEPTQPTRNADQIEADVTAARHRIANNVETLVDQVHPNRIKQRQLDKLRAFVDTEIETAKSLVFNARGDLRVDRVALIAAAAVGTIAFVVVVRSLTGRGRDD